MVTPVQPPSTRSRQKGDTESLSLRQDDGDGQHQPRQRPSSAKGTPRRGETLPISSAGRASTPHSSAVGLPSEALSSEGPPRDDPQRMAITLVADRVQDGRASERSMVGAVLGARYKLLQAVARGGMGEVYVARHLTLHTLVAVKVMLAEVAIVEDYQRRFRREARAMSLLNHRNIVKVMDFGFHHESPYIVMEMLNGEPLSQWLYRQETLPSLDVVDVIMGDLFSAFEAAHNVGVIHRDLKPDNIFLSIESDGQQVLKVLDFGLARIDGPAARDSIVTNVALVSGTPEYMSPEQCRSLLVTPSADIYSMGCLLTELLQGFPPFDGTSHVDIMTKQMFVAPPPLVRAAGDELVPLLLEKLRRDLLAKNPLRRPHSIALVRERWNEALDPGRAQQRLPGRKKPPPMGARFERQQDWTQPEVAALRNDPEQRWVVGMLGLSAAPYGVDDECVVGLAEGGCDARPFTRGMSLTDVDVVLVDAGTNLDAACAWLTAQWPELRAMQLARPVVCVRQLDAAVLNRLIVAGAGDVLVYPVEVVALVRKVRRSLRKARRQQAWSSGRHG